MRVANRSPSALVLPNGTELQKNGGEAVFSADVWAALALHPVVAAWLRLKHITAEPVAATAPAPEQTKPSKPPGRTGKSAAPPPDPGSSETFKSPLLD